MSNYPPYDPYQQQQQQSQYPYQPPQQSNQSGPGPFGLDPRVAGLLAYAPCCIGLIASLAFIFTEKNNRFVRFHAVQSLFLHGVFFVLGIGFSVLFTILGLIPVINFIAAIASIPLSLLLLAVQLGVTIYLMIKAYGGEMTKLPTIGDLAEKNINLGL